MQPPKSLIDRAKAHLMRVDYEGESYAVISQLIRRIKRIYEHLDAHGCGCEDLDKAIHHEEND